MSIRARLFLAVGVPVAVLVMALGLLAWSGARVAVSQSIQHELGAVAIMAAQTVNPVTARFLLAGDEETRSYKRLVQKLAAIKKATGSSRVLLIGADEKVRADADAALPIFGAAPRVALDRAELTRALEGDGAAVSVPFEDDAGRRYLTAYVRVPEREGDLVESDAPMVLVIEAPAALLDLTDEVATYLLLVSFFAVCLVFVFAALVARTITAPVLALAHEAEALGEGRLERPLTRGGGADEVARLASTLEAMRRALLDRDLERQMMLAGIAHEVRNPLGGMELFSGLLEEQIAELPTTPKGDAPWVPRETKEDLASHAGRVRRELRYLTGVVNDFLAFARDLPLTRERVDVKALLEDVRSLKASQPRPELAELVVECSVETPFALDRGRIKEALLNLVTNAQQATPAGGRVTLRARKDDDGRLVLEVIDTGAGMPSEDIARTFTPFFTTKEKGSGLGLALVRKFARDHGGDATLESELGRGTTVRLTLAPGSPDDEGRSTSERSAAALEDEPALLG